MEKQRLKQSWKKKKGGTIPHGIKVYYRAIGIKTVWCLQRHTDQRKRMESLT